MCLEGGENWFWYCIACPSVFGLIRTQAKQNSAEKVLFIGLITEFLCRLKELAPDEEKFCAEGAEEVEAEIRKLR